MEITSALEFEFTPAHVRNAAGLTYRQINQWEENGVLPRDSERGRSWRRFGAREMFAILICAELRKRFDTPYEDLAWLQARIVNDAVDPLRLSLDEMAARATAVYLLTDFRDIVRVANDVQQAETFRNASLRDEVEHGFVMLRLNGIVNRLLALAGLSTPLPITDMHYDALRRAESVNVASTVEEVRALSLLRRTDVDRVSFIFESGRVARAEIEQTLRGIKAADVAAVMAAAPYQVVQVSRTAEGVRSVKKRTSEVLGATRRRHPNEKSPSRPQKRSR